MERREAPMFFAQLLKLGKARGEILDEERIEIYFEDLEEFSLSQVLEAMAWARKNLGHFPYIPELRRCIEGNPETHADNAWPSLRNLLQAHPRHSLLIPDAVMAKTMQTLWPYGWGELSDKVGNIESTIERANVEKIFKRAYLEQWKRCDGLPAPVRFKGTDEIAFDRNQAEWPTIKEVCTYTLVGSVVKLHERIPVPEPERQKGEPIPPDIQERIDRFLVGFRRDNSRPHCRISAKEVTRDTYDPLVPGSQNSPAPHV